MRRGTTPTYQRTYTEDLTGGMVNFCFWQGSTETVIPAEVTSTEYGCLLSVTLTQEQTLAFELGILYWQIRAIKNGEAIASEVYGEVVTDCHPNGAIEEPELGFSMPQETPEEETEDEPEEQTEEPTEENWEDWQEREDEPAPEEEAEEGEE